MKRLKRRITAAQVLADPEWAVALYLQGLPAPTLREQGARRLTGAGLRHAPSGRGPGGPRTSHGEAAAR
ncbi:hypothetical protein [Nocardiopsis tropica]|uniref:Transposase n=1 Tax=Nocardiopsis tropica TaxID=109330 RepID=A0ABU7KZE2_9ACTN|nr:hypothetical protein [Nocardiopsis umidischolae]MEE2054671.1 hypothetical protein [Nocardiopsis umidischolae]